VTDQFQYVSVLLSMVVALAVTHLLAGIAAIIRAKVTRYSFVHLVWVGVLLLSCVDFWLSMWGLRSREVWSLSYILYWLVLSTVLYLSCYLVMPAARDGDSIDLVEFNETNRRRYLGTYFMYCALSVLANLTITGFADALINNVLAVALIGCAWVSRDVRVQVAVAVAMVAEFAYYAVRFIPSL